MTINSCEAAYRGERKAHESRDKALEETCLQTLEGTERAEASELTSQGLVRPVDHWTEARQLSNVHTDRKTQAQLIRFIRGSVPFRVAEPFQ